MPAGKLLWASFTFLCLAACAESQPVAVVPQEEAPAPEPPHQTRRPNLLVVVADDMRADALGYAGNSIIQTPNLDDIARRGVFFQNAYVTTPVCAISRASILTGQYARRHRVLDFTRDLPPETLAQTYPVLLRAAGYRSGFIGKYGIGVRPPTDAFDFWWGFADQGKYEQVDSLGRPVHLTRLIAHQASAFLEAQPRDRPFVLSVSFKAPHVQDEDARQFITDPVEAGLYSDVEIPAPVTAGDEFWQAHPEFFRVNNEGRERWKNLFGNPQMFQASAKGYYRLVTGLDRAVGEIRATLRRLKLDQNTVIVFTSDNGFYMGELGLAHKWYGHDPSVRVPLIVYDPRLGGGGARTETAVALNIDIAPTLLQLAGEPVPAQMQGRSMVPVLRGEKSAWRDDFLFEHLFQHSRIKRSAGVVGGRYKYLRYVDPVPDYEMLYDLAADPHETTDLARDARYRSTLESLRVRYDELSSQAR